MTIDRRNFFKTIGVAGITIAGFQAAKANSPDDGEIEFHGVLYDSTQCVGCQECERACAKAHDLPEPTEELQVGIIRKTSEKQRSVVNCYSTSKGDVFVRNQCMHCNEPACAAACLTQAMYKTKEGPVIWRGDKCMGCRYCMVSCPFNVPKFEYHSANPKIVKCDMCYERTMKGEKPVCAETCQAGALFYGTRRELIAEARRRIAASPADYVGEIYGEHVAGGTANLYLSSVDFKEIGLNTALQNESYPALTKGFLYSVASVDVLLPALLLGIYSATKKNQSKEEEYE